MKRMVYPFLAFLMFLLFSEYSYGQAYNFIIYSVNEGLPHGQVTDLTQTPDGFLWVATAGGGLSRFDGHTFQTFTIEDGLRDDFVMNVFIDSQNRIWVSTYYGGVALLEGDRFINPFEDEMIDNSYVTMITEAPGGDLWFGTFENGILIYDGDSFRQLSTEDGLIDDAIWHASWEEDGLIYISTHAGLSIYDGTTFKNFSEEDGFSGDKVFKMVTDSDGLRWFATSRGVTTYDGDTFTPVTEIDGHQLRYIFDIHYSSEGELWIGTEADGLFRKTDKTFEQITKREGLSSNYIHRIFEDRDQNIWIATDENGFALFGGEDFRLFNTMYGLPSNEILSLSKASDGTIWVGTLNGLSSFDGRRFQNYPMFDPDPLRNYVWDIHELEDGTLLIVDYNYSLKVFDGATYRPFPPAEPLSDWYIYDIFFDSRGRLWIGGDSGLALYDNGDLTLFSADDGLTGTMIFHIYEDHLGQLWFGTDSGVSRYDGHQFQSILPWQGLSHYNVNYITQDWNHNYWLGTSGGITFLPFGEFLNPDSMINFGRQEGMRLLETNFLWVDVVNEILWQGTNGGLQSINLNTFYSEGTSAIQHHRLSRYGIGIETTHKTAIDVDGTLWFGSGAGIVILNPENIMMQNSLPQTYLTGILLNGSVPDWSEFRREDIFRYGRRIFPDIRVPSGRNSFVFEFTAPEFLNPGNISYRYMMEGLDPDWNNPITGRQSVYASVPPGEYRFYVQARYGLGEWGPAATYSLSISRPFWQRSAFLFLMGLLLAAGVYGFITYRISHLEKVNLANLVDEKTADLRKSVQEQEILVKEVHHRVKNNLAMICGLLELQAATLTDEQAKNVLRDSILRIYSMSLVHEKLYSNENLTEINISNYIPELLETISHSMNLKKTGIVVHHDIDDLTLSLDTGISCGLLINELVTNSVKHAFNGHQNSPEIFVAFKESGSGKYVEVRDNGKGIDLDAAETKQSSLGLTLIKSLARQLNGELDIETNSRGSRFTIHF
ncbi:MAG: hypothetical protein EA360_11795 [Balneolaceae bacterium]|nr:MAG: hypothetical protein EA360_11795 [Balneolaceae bacterium]